MDELCAPYAAVIDIDRSKLPSRATVDGWAAEQFVAALRHVPSDPAFNPHLRQLLHVGYKVAAKLGRALTSTQPRRRARTRWRRMSPKTSTTGI